jgi:hypothetical protein
MHGYRLGSTACTLRTWIPKATEIGYSQPCAMVVEEAQPSICTEADHHYHHRHRSEFCRARLSLLAAVRPCSPCTSILRWRHCRACRLPQRFRARGSDHRRRGCWRRCPGSRTGRLHDATLIPRARRARAALCRTGRRGRVSCRTRARAARRAHGGLARDNRNCRRDHRGDDGFYPCGSLPRPIPSRALLPV